MFREPLPKHVDLRKLAVQGAEIRSTVSLARLPRLASAVQDASGEALVKLDFSVDPQGLKVIEGDIDTEVGVICQRCLQAMTLKLHADVSLAIVWDDIDARHLPKHLDPLILGEGESDLHDLVEEELILALPFVNYHDPDECSGKQSYSSGTEQTKAEPEGSSPFSVLEQLKNKP